jgi:hypothetical protein
MMSNYIPKPDQYARFGDKFEGPVPTNMTGRVKISLVSATTVDINFIAT